MSHWREKVIVVTGGSAGLGLVIAETFAALDATVVIISRNKTTLEQAVKGSPQELNYVVGDVCDSSSVSQCIDEIESRFGRVDVWINNVGQSIRGDFASLTVEDYQRLMEVNFFSAVRCTSAVMPLLEQSGGSVVNIGSLAARTGWRHVAPYTTSKHALSAYSHQVRLEGPNDVHCLFVCCGPIKREDAGRRYADQTQGLDASVERPGAGVKLKGIEPTVLASKIEVAVRRRKAELMVPAYARVLFAIQQLSPTIGDWLLKKLNRSKS